ncbi:hypothetical protein PoB_004309200 [Plakobranchus ocellatus]|uniref:Uncharacterized protein n=1 Tax=Plakobranchus ocellatus TaxID=259542 RepID=A0AAV4BBP0_9GAST|nr:hypothetical protein PoB_004309200 [Plakobranchus ocellatus]
MVTELLDEYEWPYCRIHFIFLTLLQLSHSDKGVSDTVDNNPALRPAWSMLSWARAPPLAPWPDGGLKS